MKKVIFVCVHNAGRSQMAEAFARMLGQGKIEAESAGNIPGTQINPMAIIAMNELGYDLTTHTPKMMTPEMVQSADRIITMGCGVDAEACPVRFLVSEDWGLDDPKDQPLEKVREIRDQIRVRVENLINELAQ